MRSHAQVVVIGGGVVGCSVIYHLTKLGWKDVVLIERSELTSGSTWHAAGGFHTLNADTNMAALQGYTIRLYRELEEITGQSCSLHHVGGITLAESPERLDFLKSARAMHRHMGLDTELITPEEIREALPDHQYRRRARRALRSARRAPGSVRHHACLRQSGADAGRGNRAAQPACWKPIRAPTAGWDVVTEQGTVIAEQLVNAAGLWAREVGAMAGVYLPLHPMEHQYFATDAIAEVHDRDQELPHVMDPEGESYLRQEGKGLVIGFYEQNCVPWAVDGTRWDFGHELLDDNLDRIGDSMEFAFKPLPGARRGRHQDDHQRPLHLRPGRQSAGRPGAGTAQLLVGLRGDGRVQPGRRRRPDAGRMDGRRRTVARRIRDGRGALRRLLHAVPTRASR